MKYSLLLQPKQDGRGSYKLNVASDTKYINTCNTDTYSKLLEKIHHTGKKNG